MLLLLAWPLVRAVCPNHVVVVFHHLTGTALDLGPVAFIIKTYSSYLPPHLFQPFLDLSSPPRT